MAAYELIPGTDELAEDIADLKFAAYLDSVACAVIDDIAYGVSGWYSLAVFESTDQTTALADENAVFVDRSPDAPGAVYNLERGDIFIDDIGVQIYYKRALRPQTITVSPGGSSVTTVPTSLAETASALVTGPNEQGYAWPYLERFDLKNKKWLSRILLPGSGIKEPAQYYESFPDGTARITVDLPYMPPHNLTDPVIMFDIEFQTLNQNLGANSWFTFHIDLSKADLAAEWMGYDLTQVTYSQIKLHGGGVRHVADFTAAANAQLNWGANPEGSIYLYAYDGDPSADEYIVGFLPHVDGPPPPSSGYPYAAGGGFAGAIDGKLYFGGGYGGYVSGYEFFVFDPKTEKFTRLPDTPSGFANEFAGFHGHGVINDKLFVFAEVGPNSVMIFDPVLESWSLTDLTGVSAAQVPYDQYVGMALGGKLYFAEGPIIEVDVDSSTVKQVDNTYLGLGPSVAIGGLIHSSTTNPPVNFSNPYIATTGTRVYNPETNTWTARTDITEHSPARASGGAFSVSYKGGHYLLAAYYPLNENTFWRFSGPVYALIPDERRNPYADENVFSGIYPDNSFPLVDGLPDEEQTRRLRAREDSLRARGLL